MKPQGETQTMKHLILIAALSLAACDKAANFASRSEPVEQTTPAPAPAPVVIGSGQMLTSPGVKVLVGPASIHPGEARFSLVMLDAPPFVTAKRWPSITCMTFDAQHRLIGAQGGDELAALTLGERGLDRHKSKRPRHSGEDGEAESVGPGSGGQEGPNVRELQS
jgi:hypothetical protein